MSNLHDTLAAKIPRWRAEIRELLEKHGDTVVSTINLEQLLKGMRGVNAVLCDTSYVDPEEGLFIRGLPMLSLMDRSAEEIFFLLCTGELPGAEALRQLQDELSRRAEVPPYVWQMFASLPEDTHPMALLSAAMLAMQRESHFTRRYSRGLSREAHWEATLEDALDIIARLPVIAARIYRTRLLGQAPIAPADGLGFADNFARMLGLDDPDGTFRNFLKQFIIVHSDHEGANASVLTSRIVNSSLADLYYSISGSMNSLAGPLHGLANQESVKFALAIRERFAGVPDAAALSAYVWDYLSAGHVIPGFGHAVLRSDDPRYRALYDFGKRVCPDNPVFRIVELLGTVVPPLLQKQGKAKNPYPNIDGISGALLYHFGITELQFYTVMFSTAQVLGICAQLISSRAIGTSIFRPKSVTTRWLQGFVSDVM